MNAATALLLVSGLGFLLSKGGWQSTLGFSFGYASIALLVSAFLRPSIRGAGLPLITAAIVGWLVLTSMFAVALSLEGSSEDADVSTLICASTRSNAKVRASSSPSYCAAHRSTKWFY
jgi:hypothetical protein